MRLDASLGFGGDGLEVWVGRGLVSRSGWAHSPERAATGQPGAERSREAAKRATGRVAESVNRGGITQG